MKCKECLYRNVRCCKDAAKDKDEACGKFWPINGEVYCEECRAVKPCSPHLNGPRQFGCRDWKWGMR